MTNRFGTSHTARNGKDRSQRGTGHGQISEPTILGVFDFLLLEEPHRGALCMDLRAGQSFVVFLK